MQCTRAATAQAAARQGAVLTVSHRQAGGGYRGGLGPAEGWPSCFVAGRGGRGQGQGPRRQRARGRLTGHATAQSKRRLRRPRRRGHRNMRMILSAISSTNTRVTIRAKMQAPSFQLLLWRTMWRTRAVAARRRLCVTSTSSSSSPSSRVCRSSSSPMVTAMCCSGGPRGGGARDARRGQTQRAAGAGRSRRRSRLLPCPAVRPRLRRTQCRRPGVWGGTPARPLAPPLPGAAHLCADHGLLHVLQLLVLLPHHLLLQLHQAARVERGGRLGLAPAPAWARAASAGAAEQLVPLAARRLPLERRLDLLAAAAQRVQLVAPPEALLLAPAARGARGGGRGWQLGRRGAARGSVRGRGQVPHWCRAAARLAAVAIACAVRQPRLSWGPSRPPAVARALTARLSRRASRASGQACRGSCRVCRACGARPP